MNVTQYRRRALRTARHRSPRTWRYALNLGPTLSYRLHRPRLSGESARVVAELREHGVAISSVSELGIADEFGDVTSALTQAWDVERHSDDAEKAFLDEILGHVPTLAPTSPWALLALAAPVRSIADGYLGMFTQLRYYNVWRNRPTPEPPRSSQLWHRDRDDFMILKMFIHLDGVGRGAGPFRYARGTHSTGPNHQDPKWTVEDGVNRASDEEVAPVATPSDWVDAIGPAGTVVFADTTGLHCGGWARTNERRLFTCMYTSRDSQAREWFERSPDLQSPEDPGLRFALGRGREGPAWVPRRSPAT